MVGGQPDAEGRGQSAVQLGRRPGHLGPLGSTRCSAVLEVEDLNQLEQRLLDSLDNPVEFVVSFT